MENYKKTKQQLKEQFGTLNGLTSKEAEEKLNSLGENILEQTEKKNFFKIFLDQFKDLLVIILIISALISLASGNVESTIVILVVIILNAILGTVQYFKAEKSLDALRELSSPVSKVIRNGGKMEIPSKKIVPGDILILEAGDMVPADGRIIENYSLQVNESSLTGESLNVDKADIVLQDETPLADRVNMVYSGTLVTYGRAKVIVTNTAMDTEIGNIASLMNDTKNKKTPLQISMDNFSKKLALVIMGICGFVLLLSLIRGQALLDSLMFAVALAVAAIPEALTSIITIVQAMGTSRMAKENAIIKDLKAVESLGCVSVICSDKTGTLTQNKMTVEDIYVNNKILKPENCSCDNLTERFLIYNAILNNDSEISTEKNIGDPTETCLLEMVERANVLKNETYVNLRKKFLREEENPFDSTRKIMSSQYEIDNKKIVFTKGAVDVLINKIKSISLNGEVREIKDSDIKNIMETNYNFSKNGYRVLAFGYKEIYKEENLSFENEEDFVFLGLISLMDPPRTESKEAVKHAKEAGIKPIMITGDHKETARAIAEKIGIYNENDLVMTGEELDRINDKELNDKIKKVSVYARVSPENKIRIVDAWQRQGNIVAMTGDGVNDAPALKKADIGIAMGITGTEVSKDASSMILADDNFATIIKAVSNGRSVYRNIINSILFLLSGNLAAIIVVLICSLLNLDVPFKPVHLLFINLLTDSLPALAIGMEKVDESLLKSKPRNPKKGIFTQKFTKELLLYGCLISIVTFAGFLMGDRTSSLKASTMAFAVLTLARLFHGFNCRSDLSIVKIKLGTNKWIIGAFAIGVILLLGVLTIPPLKTMFMIENLDIMELVKILALAFLPTLIIQIKKSICDLFRK